MALDEAVIIVIIFSMKNCGRSSVAGEFRNL